MEAFSAGTEEGAEDTSEPRKSRLKLLRSRLFSRSKRAGGDFAAKFSRSASDIHAAKALGSDEDLACPQGTLGSRALSHDSVFWAEQVRPDRADGEPVRVLSQENVHGKIKALQLKLQQQKMHLGPPPLVLPTRRQEDEGGPPEDGPPPRKSPEFPTVDVATYGVLAKVLSQPSSRPLSPIFKPPDSKSATGPPREAPSGFGAPARFTPSLDTSAARHRVSVKPRNQRASTKRRLAEPDIKVDDSDKHPEPVTDELARDVVTPEDERGGGNECQRSFSKHAQPEALPSEVTPDLASPGGFSAVSSQELQLKLQRQAVVTSSEGPRPHLEAKQTTDISGDPGIQVENLDESDVVSSRQLSNSCASAVSKSSQEEADRDGGRELRRPGYGSFHFSITSVKSRVEDRPRSGSFAGNVGPKVEGIMSSPGKREERKDPQTGERASVVGRLPRGPGPRWERQDSGKRAESAKIKDGVPSEEAESGREAAWETVVATKAEVGDEEGKTVFGFKLRSTTNSVRFWSNGSSGKPSSEERSEGLKRRESTDHDSLSKNVSAGNLTPKDPVPACEPPSTCEAPTLPTQVPANSSDQSPEPPATPFAGSPEVSWVSLAMEKTRSLHQLFSRRFPKDPASPAPQTPARALNGRSQSLRLQECDKQARGGGKGETEPSKLYRKTTVNAEAQQSHRAHLVLDRGLPSSRDLRRSLTRPRDGIRHLGATRACNPERSSPNPQRRRRTRGKEPSRERRAPRCRASAAFGRDRSATRLRFWRGRRSGAVHRRPGGAHLSGKGEK
ncbi:capping protein-inhibiting regulator of actin dynamics-like isoform X2 [Syngnathoides biaculeatus]|uniref:capping protein-inhibiting regulator of actin dynamics-like isoform X2 n=1 Tax=Syngnathoides biaculeatus TaxID=300417 RepID=UPI002ADD964B|nr:capping protein-inhibiting regulator of actin dynamics-like isoform X2 [Syngnathoides biaculeatus]